MISGDRSCYPKAACLQELPVFLACTVPASGAHQHLQICHFARAWLVRATNDVLDHEDTRIARHSAVQHTEDAFAIAVIPEVQDVLQHVDVTTGGYRLEEIAGNEIDPAPHGGVQSLPSRFDHVRQFEQGPFRAWVLLEDNLVWSRSAESIVA